MATVVTGTPACWWCGVEPTDTVTIHTFGDTTVRVVPTGWPPADHRHALTPPTPEELVADGHRILRRILEDA